MGAVSAILCRVQQGYAHWCAACEGLHRIRTEGQPSWSFNGDVNVPTFSPSVRVTYNGPDADQRREDGSRAPSACCHYFVVAGEIQYQADCSHDLSGQTVPLPELPAAYRNVA